MIRATEKQVKLLGAKFHYSIIGTEKPEIANVIREYMKNKGKRLFTELTIGEASELIKRVLSV